MSHLYFLDAALEAAEVAYSKSEVPVGCVVVMDNEIILTTHNQTNIDRSPISHAEMIAAKIIYANMDTKIESRCCDRVHTNNILVDDSSSTFVKHSFSSLTFYITIEPCVMCARILKSINAKVYFGCYNDIFGYYRITGGKYGICLEDKRCIEILQKCYKRENIHAPYPKKK